MRQHSLGELTKRLENPKRLSGVAEFWRVQVTIVNQSGVPDTVLVGYLEYVDEEEKWYVTDQAGENGVAIPPYYFRIEAL